MVRVGSQKLPHKEISHLHADINAAVGAILLLRTIRQVREFEGFAEELADLVSCELGVVHVRRGERVVVESYAVDDADQKEGPVGASFRDFDIAAIVDGEEYMSRPRKVGESTLESGGIGCLHQHEGHGGPKEDDLRVFVLAKLLPLEISGICVSGMVGFENGITDEYELFPECNTLDSLVSD